jgi:hypothetical protein
MTNIQLYEMSRHFFAFCLKKPIRFALWLFVNKKRRSWLEEPKVKKRGRLKQLNKRNQINRSIYPMSELKVLDIKLNSGGYGFL